jgi:chaperone required for assembly of F1-ATPase
MKRFWKAAEAVEREHGWGVELDGKPLRTPARVPLIVPTEGLAGAIAGEWNAVEEKIHPRSMPLTGLANAAVDRVAPNRQAFAEGLARYAEADLACYRAEGPSGLVDFQAEHWDPLLSWGRRRFDVDFNTTTGIVHVAQPAATVERLVHAISALDAFHLAGLSPLVTIGGSLLAALGVLESAFTPEQAWDGVSVDDRWQLEQWGSDAEAEAALANRRWDFLAAAKFLELLS